jgi:hypothetical protein
MQGCTVANFDPAPGTDVYDACRQFYICQTKTRSHFASLIFSEHFLKPLLYDIEQRLQKATIFRKENDRKIPFPWRKCLNILFRVANINTKTEKLFTVEDVRNKIIRLVYREMLSNRQAICLMLKKPIKLRGRYGIQMAESDATMIPGAIRKDPIYINERRAFGRNYKIGYRHHIGPHLKMAREKVYNIKPYLIPDGHNAPIY